MVFLRIYGEPVPHRLHGMAVKKRGKNGQFIYDEKKREYVYTALHFPTTETQHWQAAIRQQIIRLIETQQIDAKLPIGGPVRVIAWEFLTRGYGHSKKDDETRPRLNINLGKNNCIVRPFETSIRTYTPDKSPDWDNLNKSMQDCLFNKDDPKQGAIADDGQIVSIVLHERWAWLDYPDCGEQPPGVAYYIEPLKVPDSAMMRDLNARQRKLIVRFEEGVSVEELRRVFKASRDRLKDCTGAMSEHWRDFRYYPVGIREEKVKQEEDHERRTPRQMEY